MPGASDSSKTGYSTEVTDPEKKDIHDTASVRDKGLTMGSVGSPSGEKSVTPQKKNEGALQHVMSSRKIIYAFILIWIVQFCLAFSQGIFRVLVPYVTSNFQMHALTATTTVVANIASGIVRLPYAKLLALWGRPQCMALMVVFTTFGAVMMAACQNVETYCAAQVFYNVGYYGIQFSLVIFITDVAPLVNRGLLMGLISSPSIAAIWAYGPATESILDTIGFRWGFAIWCICIPVFCAPLLVVLFKMDKKARQAGYITKPSTDRTWSQSMIFYFYEFDVIGLLLLATGLCFILISLSIYSYQEEEWGSALIISLLVAGPLLIVAFGVYEKYLAPTTFLPWELIKDRTVVFTNIMAAFLYTSEFIVIAYKYSMLIVVFEQTVTQAAYISNIYMVGASFWNILLGVAFRYNGRIKYYALLLGIPFFILGQGLLIRFEPSFMPIGLMVFCQIMISFGGGTMYPVEQMTLMAVSQEHTPALLAVESVIVDGGKGAGSAIGTAIWTAMFKDKLAKYLPSNELVNLNDIYGSIDVQSSYAPGSPARQAIDHAYLDTQRINFIVATSLLALAWGSVLFWRDIDVREDKIAEQTLDKKSEDQIHI